MNFDRILIALHLKKMPQAKPIVVPEPVLRHVGQPYRNMGLKAELRPAMTEANPTSAPKLDTSSFENVMLGQQTHGYSPAPAPEPEPERFSSGGGGDFGGGGASGSWESPSPSPSPSYESSSSSSSYSSSSDSSSSSSESSSSSSCSSD
jgi:hypothetical protein